MTLWKTPNHKGGEHINTCQGLGEGGEFDYKGAEQINFFGVMELFWIPIVVVAFTQIYTCVKTHEMYTKKRKIFCKFFTKTILKRQIQTLEGRIVLFSNKSLGSILIFSLPKVWRIYLIVLTEVSGVKSILPTKLRQWLRGNFKMSDFNFNQTNHPSTGCGAGRGPDKKCNSNHITLLKTESQFSNSKCSINLRN